MIADPRAAGQDTEPIVYVIDDDESIRELLTWLMKREKLRVEAFGNAQSFLKAWRPNQPGCLVLDLFMPGMSGLDLQQYLNAHEVEVPVIFLSGRADVSRAVEAVKSGAFDFVEKPFDYKRIVALVRECLERDSRLRSEREQRRMLADRVAALTQREREVMDRVVAGQLNRVIAEELDISIKTVEAHRSHIMEKLGVSSLAELVQAVLEAKRVRPAAR
ncbi:Transcriptional regulatory protein TdiR [Usitatibacter rugosus]|uniref:Transcriptional regulatory protein TdiR n=1 Tax=Usitatibacter rugosus TaxID=2732067 RepID=A0A6M4GTT3_9PROT|nr:response regulator [Usitatibacter rugosus]QJR10258.1 Transcriptional regulatory protein TdiR [Usitatibacter rugosus]